MFTVNDNLILLKSQLSSDLKNMFSCELTSLIHITACRGRYYKFAHRFIVVDSTLVSLCCRSVALFTTIFTTLRGSVFPSNINRLTRFDSTFSAGLKLISVLVHVAQHFFHRCVADSLLEENGLDLRCWDDPQ